MDLSDSWGNLALPAQELVWNDTKDQSWADLGDQRLYIYTRYSIDDFSRHLIGMVLYEVGPSSASGFQSHKSLAAYSTECTTFAEMVLTWSRLQADPWTYLIKAVI